MIYDEIKNVSRYRGISENLDIAIDFMEKTDLKSLPLGRTEICGDRVFANVMEAQARDEEKLNFEIHRKYMDIQIDLEGTEAILVGLGEVQEKEPFSPEKDFGSCTAVRFHTRHHVICTGQYFNDIRIGICIFFNQRQLTVYMGNQVFQSLVNFALCIAAFDFNMLAIHIELCRLDGFD